VDRRGGDITLIPTRLGTLRVEASGSGRPVVLWHSLFVDSTSWIRVRTALGASRRLLLIDGPSHGGSASPPRRFTLEECADAAIEILDDLGVTEPVDWVGNAWGGHVGVLFAAAHPERCRSLVTIGTPVHALGALERRRIRMMVALYRFVGPVGFLVKAVERGLLSRRTRATDPEAVHLVATAVRHAERRGMLTAMRSVMLGRPDLTPVLPSVIAPTLIVTGDDLPVLSPSAARAAAALLPHGSSAVIPGTRHLAPLESAQALEELVISFWRNADPPRGAASPELDPGAPNPNADAPGGGGHAASEQGPRRTAAESGTVEQDAKDKRNEKGAGLTVLDPFRIEI
jgi:pimeloyl-ACP methyl ester carboxylesterase